MSVVPWKRLLDELLNDGQVCPYCLSPGYISETFMDPAEYAHDHADLGAALNGFSLNETGALSGAIEKTGQAVDATYMSTTKLVRTLLFSSPAGSSISFLAARSRAKLGGAPSRVFAVCCNNQEITCLSSSKTCSI
jgi:hypothetical protein